MKRSIFAAMAITLTAVGCTPSESNSKKTSTVVAQEEVLPAVPAKTDDGTVRDGAEKSVAAAPAMTAPKKSASVEKTDAKKDMPMPAYLKDVALIDREVFFGNPDKAGARLSPDAKRLSYLAPSNGVLNVWVGPADDPSAAKVVTKDTKRGIRNYFWAYTNKHIIYLQDTGGDENWHVYLTDLDSGETTDLTPLEKVQARIDGVSYKFPNEIMVGLNDRNEQLHDVYKVKLDTAERKLVQKNDGDFTSFVIDEDYKVRFASRSLPDGGREYLEPDGDGWKQFMSVSMEDEMTTGPAGFDKTGEILYLIDSRGRDTGALYAWNLKTGDKKMIAGNDKADVGSVISHPTENTIQAVAFTYLREEWDILDPAIQADFDYLHSVTDGEIQVASQSLDNNHWVVAFVEDNGPVRYYRYDREGEKKATFLFTNRKSLEGLPLAKMHPLLIPARDGLQLVSYLTLPPGTDSDNDARPSEPLPLVLDVHGGPWARDDWGYNPVHQWLANRGYAVLSVNFRGSTGFGKSFVNAGNKEWAGKMHFDLLDAVDYCVKEKIAEPKRVGIMGGSYGGYATLVAMTMTPDVFACGVDIVGPSNIITLLQTIPPYWKPDIQMFKDRVGDFDSEEGQKFLLERSPLTHVAEIKRPLLIGQGANDPRVKQSEADQIVAAMKEKKIPVVYVLFPDEGHGFARPANRLSFNAVTEAFLAEYLGGRYEPIGGDFKGSSITVPAGADDVPGLAEALKDVSK